MEKHVEEMIRIPLLQPLGGGVGLRRILLKKRLLRIIYEEGMKLRRLGIWVSL